MASWMVHLRIADALLPHLMPIDETAFVVGGIAADSGVPAADGSEFRPPKAVTHFQRKTDKGHTIDTGAFCRGFFNPELIRKYSLKEYSFFLGYYVHLLTDILWIQEIVRPLKTVFPDAYAEDRNKLIDQAKEDWYDLDFLYLAQHPGFRAFTIYENAKDFDNTFMELFDRDAFENKRRYVCDFYRSESHGTLQRAYRYLTPNRADSFVLDASLQILTEIAPYLLLS